MIDQHLVPILTCVDLISVRCCVSYFCSRSVANTCSCVINYSSSAVVNCDVYNYAFFFLVLQSCLLLGWNYFKKLVQFRCWLLDQAIRELQAMISHYKYLFRVFCHLNFLFERALESDQKVAISFWIWSLCLQNRSFFVHGLRTSQC